MNKGNGMRFFRNDKFLYEKQSGDTLVQVLQRADRRELRFGNHITQSAISTSEPDRLQLDYTRAMMAVFLFAPDARSFLHIGLGGGTLPRFIHNHFPKVRQTLVELSPEVIDVAYRYFDLPLSPRIRVVRAEGEAFLKATTDKFQVIYLDAFHANGVPDQFNSPVFFNSVQSHLENPGWFVSNVWGSDHTTLNRVKANLCHVFPQVHAISVRWDSNVIFLASPDGATEPVHPPDEVAEDLARRVPLDFAELARNVSCVQKKGRRVAVTG